MEKMTYNMEPVTKLNELAFDYQVNPDYEFELIRILSDVLIDIGITPAYKGYNYIIDSVRILHRKGYRHILITKDIYAPVAIMYGTSPELVEHCIRTAVKKGWIKTEDMELKKSVFSSLENSPTNYTFLINVLRHVCSIINAELTSNKGVDA